jgi:hypothetical protein
MRFKVAIAGGGLSAVVLGILVLVVALGSKMARWDGYADSLPLVGLFVLFLVGQIVVSAVIPARRKVRH